MSSKGFQLPPHFLKGNRSKPALEEETNSAVLFRLVIKAGITSHCYNHRRYAGRSDRFLSKNYLELWSFRDPQLTDIVGRIKREK